MCKKRRGGLINFSQVCTLILVMPCDCGEIPISSRIAAALISSHVPHEVEVMMYCYYYYMDRSAGVVPGSSRRFRAEFGGNASVMGRSVGAAGCAAGEERGGALSIS